MRRGRSKAAREAREKDHMDNPLAVGAQQQQQQQPQQQPQRKHPEKQPLQREEAAPPQAAEGEPLTIGEIFDAVDRDRSGFIEFGEFAKYWGSKQVETRGNADEETLGTIWELFEKYDCDGNDGLSKLEFRDLITEMATGNWKEQKDPRTGRLYYVNPITRESQWTRPGVAEFLHNQGIVQTPAGRPTVEVDAASDGDEGTAEVHMVLNMWKIYIKSEQQNRKRHYSDAFTYLVYTLLLMNTVVLCTPLSATLLAHQEALTDLLLDEEFQGVENHKKSWYDVMTPAEMWEWVEGPLHDAFYPDPDSTSPQPLLWSNELLGRVQLRQARVEPTKCLSRKWVPYTYGSQALTPQPGRACAGTYSNEVERPEREFGGEATFVTKQEALDKFFKRRKSWTDDRNAAWDPGAQDNNQAADAWTGAAEWYEDWGHCWMTDPSTTLKGSPVFVESFFGELNPFRLIGRNRFGNRGYEITLPRNRWAWEEQVRQLKGEYVCVSATTHEVWGGYIADLDDVGIEERANGCATVDDCAQSAQSCTQEAGYTWEASEPFIDKYSRMLVVTFNLYNGNDFDWDEEEYFYEDHDQNSDNVVHLDDHFVFAQVSFTFGPSGHIEKYQRMSIVRPMREYGYVDSGFKKIIASLFALMAVALFLIEGRIAYRMGLSSYFFTSENSVWNLYEISFFFTFVILQYSVWNFWTECDKVDAELTEHAESGDLHDSFVDMHELKSRFRTMTRWVSQLVLQSILKSFKFMSLSDNLNFMYKILLRAKTEIFGFMTVYFILIACFAFFTQQLFGYEIRSFHNFQSSIVSLVRLSVGILDLDYTLMKEADSYYSPVFIIVFVFVCMLTAINMFIAILSEYYEIVKKESTQLKEDIQIFESQGMTVPSSSVFDGISTLWSNFWLECRLMVETDPPHVPAEVIPVRRIAGPTWGRGAQQTEDAGGVTCHANFYPNASNLVRIHLYSEFVPTELENFRGKARANIPILGEVSESRGFRSHCVGLGDSRSPINELIASYGKLWSEDIWVCGNPRCKHIYDPARDGDGRTMEELYTSEKDTWCCPKCKQRTAERPWQHIGHKFGYYRQDTGVRTVCCLKLHPDDMHSEVRPQVISKMRPRFSTVTNPKDGSQDPDYDNQCDSPDTIDLVEGDFGAHVRLELLIHEEMKEDIVYGGKCIGKARDTFALFRVTEMSSWEHFSNEPTKLSKAPGMWRNKDDRLLYEMMQVQTKGKEGSGTSSRQLTNSQMAEMFNKTERQVGLRRRFLKRLHTDANGWPVTPKVLRATFQPHWRTALRLWWQAQQDEATKVVSPSYLWGRISDSCHCKRYSDPHERDMKRFIRMLTQHVLDNEVSNRKDITELESKFLLRNMELDEAVGQMKVYLLNSGTRSMARKTWRCCGLGEKRNMFELYGDPEGDPLMVTAKNEHGQEEKISVEDKLRRWLMSKYAYELDAVVVRFEGEAEEENDIRMVVTPGGHRVRASDTSVRRMQPMPAGAPSTVGHGVGERKNAKRI